MKKIIALLLAVSLCLSLCACSLIGKIEGSGYKTPEDALLAYAKALKTADVSKILSTFAIETYVENFDDEAYMEYMNAYPFNPSSLLTPVDRYTKDLFMIDRQQSITKNLYYMSATISMGENADLVGRIISFNGDPYDDPHDFLKDLDLDSWSEILSEIEFDDDFVYMDDVADKSQEEKFEDLLYEQCDFYGCDEIIPIGLEVELDGEDCVLYMNVACYDGKWYNLTQGGHLASWLGCPTSSGGLYIEY